MRRLGEDENSSQSEELTGTATMPRAALVAAAIASATKHAANEEASFNPYEITGTQQSGVQSQQEDVPLLDAASSSDAPAVTSRLKKKKKSKTSATKPTTTGKGKGEVEAEGSDVPAQVEADAQDSAAGQEEEANSNAAENEAAAASGEEREGGQ